MPKKKILTILYFILLLAGVLSGTYLIGQKSSLSGYAQQDTKPDNIKITNISDNSFAVSWTTPTDIVGFIAYGVVEDLGQTVYDDRDDGKQTNRLTHHVTLKNLKPNTRYFFKIGSGSDLYDNNGSLFQQVTASSTASPPPIAKPLYGRVVQENGNPLKEVLIYVQLENAVPLSTYIVSDGKWLTTLTNMRDLELSKYIVPAKDAKVTILAQAGNKSAKKEIVLGNLEEVPAITLDTAFSSNTFSNFSYLPATFIIIFLIGLTVLLNFALKTTDGNKTV